MADAVTSRTLFSGGRRAIFHFTNISDGTGETAVQKIDKSALANHLGAEPGKLVIEYANWAVQGHKYVAVAFDHTVDDTALVLTGTGDLDLSDAGGLPDPAGVGGTGDILFTVGGPAAGGSYQVTLLVRLD